MHLELVELKAKERISSKELRGRTGAFPGREIDLRYLIVLNAGREVAFLWYDLFPTDFYLVLYEMYVAKRFRGQGIGSELLLRTEDLAMKRGYNRVLVRPMPLSDGIGRERLIGWYERRGYREMPDQLEIYVKDVSLGLPV